MLQLTTPWKQIGQVFQNTCGRLQSTIISTNIIFDSQHLSICTCCYTSARKTIARFLTSRMWRKRSGRPWSNHQR